MTQSDWYDTEEYHDRKSRSMAEFLVYKKVLWEDIQEIGVFDESVQSYIKTNYNIDKKISVKRDLYF